MTKITKSIEIEASPEKVWAFLTNIEKINETAKGFAEYTQTSKGPMGVGSTVHVISKAGGSQIEADMEVTEFEKNKKFTMRTVGASKFKMEQIITLEPTAKGTKAAFNANYTMPYSILGKIVDKLRVQKEVEKSLDKQSSAMKKALEA